MKVAEDRNFYVKREATHWLLKKRRIQTNRLVSILMKYLMILAYVMY